MTDAPSPNRFGSSRLEIDREEAERGLASLVLTVVELLRQLMERQAVRRMEHGDLTDDQIESMGRTLMALEDRMRRLCDDFGLSQSDLNLDLGPLGHLLPPASQ
jgi:Gas vesicle protein K